MKKFLMSAIAATTMVATAQAGTMSFDIRTDYNSTDYSDTTNDFAKFYFKTGRLDYQGKANETLTYRARLAFNKSVYPSTATPTLKDAADSTLSYVELAFLSHKVNDNFTLTAGKFNSEIGGFEGATPSTDLYLTSEAYTNKGLTTATSTLSSKHLGTADLLYMTGVKGTYTFENQTLHLLVSNESNKADSSTTQNSVLVGAIWRGSFMDKALNTSLSYHTMGDTTINDRHQYLDAGIQWNFNPYTAQFDYLAYEYKQDSDSTKDSVTSMVLKFAYNGIEHWTPRIEFTSSNDTLAVTTGKPDNKFTGMGAVIEYKPFNDQNFRYHAAYNTITQTPDNASKVTKNEFVVGARLMADFLK